MINDTVNEEKAIHIIIDKFETAWNAQDAKAFALNFSADADFTNVFGEKMHGRPAIEGFFKTIFANGLKATQLTVTEIRIRFISIDVAAVDVIWETSGTIDSAEDPIDNKKGLMQLLMKHDNGTWSILIMHTLDFPEMPPPTF